jgi:para-nitrobenzyl esterase
MASAANVDPLVVQTDAGPVRGSQANGIVSFKGIPYAAPPVGKLRWKQPQPARKWTQARDATRFGADCMQIPFPADAAPLRTKPAEDCLFVNVWRPEPAPAKSLPVIVWIYGGGFVNGGTSPAVYDGSAFARDGLVFVSFNYRLARFGFFAHPGLSAEQAGQPLANYGLLDQIAALKWVQRNIAAFGGDPKNVTLFGESAGGVSVTTMMTTPLAQGLFHKAIVQSGGGRPRLFPTKPVAGGPDSAEAAGIEFAKRLGIEGSGAEAIARLRTAPAETIAAGVNLERHESDPTYAGGPVRDDTVVFGASSASFAQGRGANVPLLIGANSADIGGYAVMVEPARHISRILSARGQAVYQYRFSYVAESVRSQWPGAYHASEIPYVFDTVAAKYGKDLTARDAAAARSIHAYWVAFAKTGKPEVAGQPEWPRYAASSDVILDFTNDGLKSAPDPWKAQIDAAEQAANDRER